CQQYSSSPPTV
nr:immunoglobulin light chain junction region [Macaca mulatta]